MPQTTKSSKSHKKQTVLFWTARTTLPLFLLIWSLIFVQLSSHVQAVKMGQAISTTQFFLYGRRHFTAYVFLLTLCAGLPALANVQEVYIK